MKQRQYRDLPPRSSLWHQKAPADQRSEQDRHTSRQYKPTTRQHDPGSRVFRRDLKQLIGDLNRRRSASPQHTAEESRDKRHRKPAPDDPFLIFHLQNPFILHNGDPPHPSSYNRPYDSVNPVLGHGDRFLVPSFFQKIQLFQKNTFFSIRILIKFMFHHAVQCRSVGGFLTGLVGSILY